MKFFRISVIVLTIIILISCTDYDSRRDQEIGNSIISAITAYRNDHKALPSTLNDLIPKYISEIPSTSSGGEFRYILSPVDGGYNLCFSGPRTKHSGCCYLPRFNLWDCTEGD